MAVPEPVTAAAPHEIKRVLQTQSWLDVAFLHWEADREAVASLLPEGTKPDLLDGRTYVGLVAFRMHRIGWLGLPGVPWIGSFPETNVRLYSVDDAGRRGVVFLSLEASRLVPVLIARTGFRLPYMWARMAIEREGDIITYASRRRWPRPPVDSRLAIRVGRPIAEPTDLERFVTARWGLHHMPLGHTRYLANEHPPWSLHRAEVVELSSDLVAAVGLPAPEGAPVSVLWSPGVRVRFGSAR